MVANMSRGYSKDPGRILKLRSQGCSYKIIAERMGVSYATIAEVTRRLTRSEAENERMIELQDVRRDLEQNR
jgi:uncharacterized protein YerC